MKLCFCDDAVLCGQQQQKQCQWLWCVYCDLWTWTWHYLRGLRDDRRGIEVGGMGPQKIMIRRLIIIIIIQFKLFWGLSHLCDFHFSRFLGISENRLWAPTLEYEWKVDQRINLTWPGSVWERERHTLWPVIGAYHYNSIIIYISGQRPETGTSDTRLLNFHYSLSHGYVTRLDNDKYWLDWGTAGSRE